jgi:hypothetical protein
MNSIKTIISGRLINDNDPNGGIYTGSTTGTTYNVPCVLAILNNDAQYLVVVEKLDISFLNKTLETTTTHYELSMVNNLWNKVQPNNIDSSLFKNLDKLITNDAVVVSTITGIVTDLTDLAAYNYNAETGVYTLKPEYVSYFNSIRYSSIGLAIESMLTNDIKGKLNKKLV